MKPTFLYKFIVNHKAMYMLRVHWGFLVVHTALQAVQYQLNSFGWFNSRSITAPEMPLHLWSGILARALYEENKGGKKRQMFLEVPHSFLSHCFVFHFSSRTETSIQQGLGLALYLLLCNMPWNSSIWHTLKDDHWAPFTAIAKEEKSA